MKRRTGIILLAVALGALCCTRLLAVDLKKGSAGVPAEANTDLSVTVELSSGGGAVFDPGERISVSFSASSDAYVVVYNIDSEGYVHLLFPADGRPARVEGGTRYVLPEPGSGAYWETGGKTGIEYLHALAVGDPGRLDEDELYFLAKSERLSEKKRLRIDMDPFLAFNMIDEEIVRGADREPPATDYTYFYINRRVDYPRYLCAKCHGSDAEADPYVDECPEVSIERIAYDEEPSYPYPPMYDIGRFADYERDEEYAEEEYDGDDTRVYLSLAFDSHPYPGYSSWYYGGSFIGWGVYPVWDPFWSSYYWNVWWNDYYWYWPYYTWWYPWYPYPYSYPYACWSCDDGWYAAGGSYRPIYGDRNVTKRYIDYTTTYTSLSREKSLVDSRLSSSKRRAADERLNRSDLRRRTSDRDVGSIERTGSRNVGRTVRTVPSRSGTKSTNRNAVIERKTTRARESDKRGEAIKPTRTERGAEQRRSSAGTSERRPEKQSSQQTTTRSYSPPERSTSKSSATPYRGGSSNTRSNSGKKRSG